MQTLWKTHIQTYRQPSQTSLLQFTLLFTLFTIPVTQQCSSAAPSLRGIVRGLGWGFSSQLSEDTMRSVAFSHLLCVRVGCGNCQVLRGVTLANEHLQNHGQLHMGREAQGIQHHGQLYMLIPVLQSVFKVMLPIPLVCVLCILAWNVFNISLIQEKHHKKLTSPFAVLYYRLRSIY